MSTEIGKRTLSIVLLACALLLMPAPGSAFDYSAQVERAREAAMQGEQKRAQSILGQLLARDPNNREARQLLETLRQAKPDSLPGLLQTPRPTPEAPFGEKLYRRLAEGTAPAVSGPEKSAQVDRNEGGRAQLAPGKTSGAGARPAAPPRKKPVKRRAAEDELEPLPPPHALAEPSAAGSDSKSLPSRGKERSPHLEALPAPVAKPKPTASRAAEASPEPAARRKSVGAPEPGRQRVTAAAEPRESALPAAAAGPSLWQQTRQGFHRLLQRYGRSQGRAAQGSEPKAAAARGAELLKQYREHARQCCAKPGSRVCEQACAERAQLERLDIYASESGPEAPCLRSTRDYCERQAMDRQIQKMKLNRAAQ